MKNSLAGGRRNKVGGLDTEHHNIPVSIYILSLLTYLRLIRIRVYYLWRVVYSTIYLDNYTRWSNQKIIFFLRQKFDSFAGVLCKNNPQEIIQVSTAL